MTMRITGMNSGLDTETIIQELVAAKRVKVDTLTKEQTKLEWKQEAWKDLNSKIYKLYNGTLSNLRFESSFMKKSTSTSNDNLVSVITDSTAMDSVQALKINRLAKAGYLTGAQISDVNGEKVTSGSSLTEKLGIAAGSKIEITTGGVTTDIVIEEGMTMNSLVTKLNAAGVKANFDTENQRLFIGAEGTGADKDFTITASNDGGTDALNKLGVLVYDDKSKAAYQKYADMSTDIAKRQEAITTKAAELLKAYATEKSSLQKEVESLNKKQEEIAKAYNEEYAAEGFDITNADDRTSRIAEINSAIESLETELADENISEEDRATKQAELNKLKGELSYLENYDKNQNSIAEKEARIAELESDYATADAGSKIEEEATAYIQEKIDKAVAVINDFASLKGSKGAVKITGEDAEIELNGAIFTSDTNAVKVNGLTITCKGETKGETITLKTENDVSGIYDMIKSFIKEYSELINEMDKLYNAESSKGYEPLTDDEKEAMSETEIEKWEEKIKDSLLRRDSTLNNVSGAMREIMASGFEVNGKTMYLSDFGIETLGYFDAADNQRNAYHIHGDEDDAAVKSETNKLQAMISTDYESVISFFTQLSKKLYDDLNDKMKTSEYKSVNSVYDDKKMKEEYDGYTTKISAAEEKLIAYEDKWYAKFSAMETALAKMQSNASAVTSLLGGM